MSRSPPIFCFSLTITILLLSTSSALSEWKPTQDFADTLKKATKVVKQINIDLKDLEEHSSSRSDVDLAKAIHECKYLLGSSGKALESTLDAIQNHDDYDGDLLDDVESCLHVVDHKEEMCLEGFRKSKRAQKKVRQALEGSLLLVRVLLGMVQGPKWKQLESSWKNQPKRTSKCVFSNVRRNHERSVLDDEQKVKPGLHGEADIVVAKDGSGKYERIMDAVNAAPTGSKRPFVIHIKKGIYDEKVEISSRKSNLVMVGDGMNATIITGNLSFSLGIPLYQTATFTVLADRFVAKNLTIQNTAGPERHQAIALLARGDHVAFHKCGFSGYQNTLYLDSKRQFFKECTISGAYDFITGSGTTVFQNSTIWVRKGLPDKSNYVTAHGVGPQGRTSSSGFSFQFCQVLPEEAIPTSIRTYLGRPRSAYSTVVFMQSYISSVVDPKGWTEWMGTLFLDTLYYAEYDNRGLGANTTRRVKWRNYHPSINRSEALKFTVSKLIEGDTWLPSLDVPFIPVGL